MYGINSITNISDINRNHKTFFKNLLVVVNKKFFPVTKTVLTLNSSISTKYILLTLYSFANKNGECFPSFRTISKKTSISLNTIKKGIGILNSNGIVEIKKHYRSNYYIINDFPESVLETVFVPRDIFDYYLSNISKLTLVALLWLRTEDNTVYKTISEIADFMSLSTKTVSKALKELQYKEYVSFNNSGRLKFPKLLWSEETW